MQRYEEGSKKQKKFLGFSALLRTFAPNL
jgi:hypothetical protein